MCLFAKCLRCKVYNNDDDPENEKNNEIDIEIIDPIEILNTYSKFKKIGVGATSKIYLTKKKDKKYICKLVNRSNFKKGFREIKILQKLNNSFFPKLHEFISFDNNLFIFMEYENSMDLHKYCFELNKNNIPIKEIINIIRQMGKAIITLHNYNFVHLDIKLENYIITKKNCIKLIDFGTVRPILEGEKKLNSMVGTRNYSPPEIYRYKYHINSDIWSYAICIWILLIKDYCFNHNQIKNAYTLENFPYELFNFPTERHLQQLSIFDVKIKKLFQQVFKIFPIDRPDIQLLTIFDYEKYLIPDK